MVVRSPPTAMRRIRFNNRTPRKPEEELDFARLFELDSPVLLSAMTEALLYLAPDTSSTSVLSRLDNNSCPHPGWPERST